MSGELLIDQRCTHKNCTDKTGAYRMVGHCRNCSTDGILGLFTEGHEHGHDTECPVCGCRCVHWDRLATADEIPAAADASP